MPSPRRLARVNQLLHEEIAACIQHEVSDPAVGFATVVEVKTSPDLVNATVYVSHLGDDAAKAAAVEALNRASGFIRRTVMPRVNLKTSPRLEFRLDVTAERAVRISTLLREGSTVRPPVSEDESLGRRPEDDVEDKEDE